MMWGKKQKKFEHTYTSSDKVGQCRNATWGGLIFEGMGDHGWQLVSVVAVVEVANVGNVGYYWKREIQ